MIHLVCLVWGGDTPGSYQGLLQAGSGVDMGRRGLNPDNPYARQTPYLLCY